MKRVAGTARPNRKWFGVQIFRMIIDTSKGFWVSICSTRHMFVDSTSSVSVLFPTIASVVSLQLQTIRSQILRSAARVNIRLFHAAIHFRISLAARKNCSILTQKGTMFSSWRCKTRNGSTTWPNWVRFWHVQLLWSSMWTSSTIVSLVVSSPWLQMVQNILLQCWLMGTLFSQAFFGRSAVKGWTLPTCCFLHLTHFNFTFLKAFWSPNIP